VSDARRPLDPEAAQRVAGLTYRARQAVTGILSGMHRSPHRGASVVFVEHRDYRPGDDLRLLDWRAFARTDRHSIKRFEQETQLRATLVLDRSASMRWDGFEDGKPGAPKDEHAATLLASLAYVLTQQGDAVGFTGFDEQLHDDAVPPRTRPGQLDTLLRALATSHTGRRTDLGAALQALAERRARRGVIALASDLLDLSEDALHPLGLLASRGHEVVVFHVLHPDELELPVDGPARFEGLEGESPIEADVADVRDGYLEEIDAFVEACRRRCEAAGARYLLARTDVPAAHTLASLLATQRRRR